MRRKRNSKIGILFITLILLLSSLVAIGGSYSYWYDYLYVEGDITTGHWYTDETAWARMNDDPEDFEHEFPGSSWATYITCIPTESQQTFYMYAGQFYRVGELYVWKDDGYLYVEYDFDSPVTMSIAHLHVATSLDGIPQTGSGNPKIGNFDYMEEYPYPHSSGDVFQIEWDDDWDDVDLYIAAHAVVWGDFE